MTGLVSRDVDEAALRDALTSRNGNATLEVRRYAAALADPWHGSAARRVWFVAHALEASDLHCPRPVAFLEGRAASVVALERRAVDAASEDEGRTLRAKLAAAGFLMEGHAAEGIARDASRGNPIVSALERVRFAPSAVPVRPRPPSGSSPRGSGSKTR
jgi:hypothetical protein